jgi:hypothetical protein
MSALPPLFRRADLSETDRVLLVEEYKALRAESLRCAQTVATTVWVGITGFLITSGAAVGAARFVQDHNALLQVSLIVLILQAFGASIMFLSEYWKFVRIGVYIRTKIEEQFETDVGGFAERDGGETKTWRPMDWEHWIQGKRRAAWFPLASLFTLQLPAAIVIVLSLAVGLDAVVAGGPSNLLLVVAGRALITDWSLATLLSVSWLLDITVTGVVAYAIFREIRKGTGERLVFSPQLLTIQRK